MRIRLLAGIVLLMIGRILVLYAQDPMIERDESKVKLEAPAGYLDHFWTACKNLQPHQTAIAIHLGDSHVQAGFFSEPIRKGFDDIFGTAGMGWAGGYSLSRTNQPTHVKVRAEGSARYSTSSITSRKYVGGSPTGMVITSTTSKSQKVSFSSSDETPVSRVVVFRSSNSEPLVYDHYFPLPKPQKVGLLPTIVADTIKILHPTSSITLTVPGRSSFYGVSLEQELGGVILHTIGYNGASYPTYSDNDFARYLPALQPELIIISLGTNDGLVNRFSSDSFRSSVESLIQQIQRYSPTCSIVLTSPLPSARISSSRRRRNTLSTSPNMKTISSELQKIAKEKKIGFIDLYQIFGGDTKFSSLRSSGFYSSDGIHLTKEGYAASGRAIADALNKDLRRYLGQKEQ